MQKCPDILNAAPQSVQIQGVQHGEQLCKVVEASTAEPSFSSRILPDKCFIVPQILSQPNGEVHQLLCWISIHLRGWFPPWSLAFEQVGGVFFVLFSFFSLFFFFSYIVYQACHLIWKESSQSVIEHWVKWLTTERLLGSFSWWGEVGHRCPFLHRQADALRTRDAFLSISPSNQCNLCLVICCTVVPLGGGKDSEKETWLREGQGLRWEVDARKRKHTKVWK